MDMLGKCICVLETTLILQKDVGKVGVLVEVFEESHEQICAVFDKKRYEIIPVIKIMFTTEIKSSSFFIYISVTSVTISNNAVPS